MRLALCMVGALAVITVLPSCGTAGPSPNAEQWQRARTACEQLGLKPESSEVSDCAANLQTALSNSPL